MILTSRILIAAILTCWVLITGVSTLRVLASRVLAGIAWWSRLMGSLGTLAAGMLPPEYCPAGYC